MASFRRNFKPTKRERMEVCLRLFRSYMDSKENHTCSTCVHRKFVQGARDHYLECEMGLERYDNCEKYKCDEAPFDDIMELMKTIYKEKE